MLNQPCPLLLLRFYPAFVSRDYHLEALIPAKHFASERGVYVRRPTLFLHSHRVDAQRECDAVFEIKSRSKPFATGEPLAVPLQVSPIVHR